MITPTVAIFPLIMAVFVTPEMFRVPFWATDSALGKLARPAYWNLWLTFRRQPALRQFWFRTA